MNAGIRTSIAVGVVGECWCMEWNRDQHCYMVGWNGIGTIAQVVGRFICAVFRSPKCWKEQYHQQFEAV